MSNEKSLPNRSPITTRYRLETVARACSLLKEFTDDRQVLTLSEIVERTGMERTICFRLLRTLEEEGLLRRADSRKFASNVRILSGKRYRIGYASQGHDSFSAAVGQGLRWAANEYPIDLVELDNQYSAKAALRNAEALVRQRVDLAIEFQVYERIGARLSTLFQDAGIPVIAVEIPQPGAYFFGVDNHRVGMIAGKSLLRGAQKEWAGECDELILLNLEIAGSLPQMRMSGVKAILAKGLTRKCITTHLESRGEFVRAFELTRKHLQHAPKRRTLLTGVNDFGVLGALRAFEEAGRSQLCIAVSIGSTPEARRELRLLNTRLVGSVAFFPERYGKGILALAMDILHEHSVPPAIYVPVQSITPRNVNEFYPKDIYGSFDIDGSIR